MEENIVPQLLAVLHYVYPFSILLSFLVAFLTAQCLPASNVSLPQRQNTISRLFWLVIVCFGLDGAVSVAGLIFWRLWPSQAEIVGLFSCTCAFIIIRQSFCRTCDVTTWYQFYGSWAFGFLCDVSAAILQCVSSAYHTFHCSPPQTGAILLLHALLAFSRCVLFGIIASVFLQQTRPDPEEAPLLPSPDVSDLALRFQKARCLYLYLWPRDTELQVKIAAVGVCLLANNGVNILIPRQNGILLNSLTAPSRKLLWHYTIWTALHFLSDTVIPYVQRRLWTNVSHHWEKVLSIKVFSHFMYLSADFHDSTDSMELNMVLESSNAIANVAEHVLFHLGSTIMDFGISVAYLSVSYGPLEGIVILFTVVTFCNFSLHRVSISIEKHRQLWKLKADEGKLRTRGISQWFTVFILDYVESTIASYTNALMSRLKMAEEISHIDNFTLAVQNLITGVGMASSVAVLIPLMRNGKATGGAFMLLWSYWTRMVGRLTHLISLTNSIGRVMTKLERFINILHTTTSTPDDEDAQPLQYQSGAVRFQNVKFGYNNEKPILKNFSLDAKPGSTVAIVGETGSGKSTITKLLMRQYDVQEGSISIDGQNIKRVTKKSLLSFMGIVPQFPQLFEASILENVRVAREGASDEDVHKACKSAAIHDQIMALSNGYKTIVKAETLSGGQKQRLGIARAFLQNPPIILLDEATSSLDIDTEQKIQKALDALKSPTKFIVSHRLYTTMKADVICVLSDGKIIESGTHRELLSQKGTYAGLWSKQTSTECMDE